MHYQHLYKNPAIDTWLCLMPLQITITLTEGYLVDFFLAILGWIIAGMAGDWTDNLRYIKITFRCLWPQTHSNLLSKGQCTFKFKLICYWMELKWFKEVSTQLTRPKSPRTWLEAIVIAAADVKPAFTGTDMKSITTPKNHHIRVYFKPKKNVKINVLPNLNIARIKIMIPLRKVNRMTCSIPLPDIW